jgi:uncharacterized protein YbaP (TraB family)
MNTCVVANVVVSRLFLFVLLWIIPCIAFAGGDSTKSYYTLDTKKATSLLWRITHDSIPHQSYLYGTIHIKDERAYRFADSVLPALNSCKAFGCEVRLDTLMNSLVSELLDTTSSKRRLKDVLTKNELDSLTPIIAEMLSVPTSVVPNLSPALLSELIETAGYYGNEKRLTILDAYLLGLARTLGKSLYALENRSGIKTLLTWYDNYSIKLLREQIASGNKVLERLNKFIKFEQLIKLYDRSQLDSLYMLSYGEKPDSMYDTMMYVRNTMMANSIDSITRLMPFFATCGSAHLSGETGVIALLRRKGYTVEPILPTYSKKKTWLDSIDITTSSKWYDYKSEKHGFSIRTPTPLFQHDLYKQMYASVELENPISFDVISGNTFSLVAFQTQVRFTDTTYSDYFKNFIGEILFKKLTKANKGKIKISPITQHQLKGFEFNDTSGYLSGYRVRGFYRGAYSYLAMVQGSAVSIKSAIVDTFFNSFVLQPIQQKEWGETKDSSAHLRFSMPGKALRPIDSDGNILTQYYSTDPITGTVYSIVWNDIDRNTNSSYKSLAKSKLLSLYYSYNSDLLKKNATYDTLPDGIFRARFKFLGEDSSSRGSGVLLFWRDKLYYITMQSDTGGDYRADSIRFFSSVSTIPLTYKREWQTYTHPMFSNVTAEFPCKPKFDSTYIKDSKDTDNKNYTSSWYATDSGCDRYYYIWSAKYSPYSGVLGLSDSVLYDSLFLFKVACQDTIVNKVFRREGNSVILEYEDISKKLPLATRYKLIFKGNNMYYIRVDAIKDDIMSDDITRFISSVSIQDTTPLYNLSELRYNKWLEDLTSRDSLSFFNARRSLSWLKFDSTNVDIIIRGLEHPSYQYDSLAKANEQYPRGVYERLYDKAENYFDSSHIVRLGELYKKFKKSPNLQISILTTLARLGTPTSLSLFTQLFVSSPPIFPDSEDVYIWGIEYAITKDSLKSITPFIPSLVKLLSNHHYKHLVYGLLRSAYEYGVIKKQEYITYTSGASADLTKYWNTYSYSLRHPKIINYNNDNMSDDETENSYKETNRYARTILEELALRYRITGFDKKVETLFRKILDETNEEDKVLEFNTVIGFLYWKKKVHDSLITRICNETWSALNLIQELDTTKNTARLPQGFRTQADLARLYAMNYISEYYEYETDSISLVTSQRIKNDSLDGIVYLFRYRSPSDSDTTWSTIMVGTFDSDSTLYLPSQKLMIRASTYSPESLSYSEHIDKLIAHTKEYGLLGAKEYDEEAD